MTLSFVLLTALLQMSLSIFGAEIPRVSSAFNDSQILLQIADEFLYCFVDKSSKIIPPIGQAYTDAVSEVIRSFAPQNESSLTKTEAITFQTSLAASIADNVAIESQQNDHPQILPMVLQLVSVCFTKITGYQPSELIRRIATFLILLLEYIYHQWNSFQMSNQEILSEVLSLEEFVNQIPLKTSLGNSKPERELANEIDQPTYDRTPRESSQSFTTNESILMERNSNFNQPTLKREINKRIEFDPLSNHGKQTLFEDDDSFNVKPRGTLQPGLKVSEGKPPIAIGPPVAKYSNSNFSVASEFATVFSDALNSSEDLSKAFDTSLHPVLASKAYYKAVYDVVFGIRRFNPVSIARIISMAVKVTFTDLTTFQHIMIYGNVVGKYLDSKMLLTPDNLMELSSLYKNFIKIALVTVKARDKREANIQGIIDGLVNFLVYLRVFPSECLLDFATDFADNFFSFTGIKRSIYNSLSPDCEGLQFNQIVNIGSNFKTNLEKSSVSVINKFRNSKYDMQREALLTCCISGNIENCVLPSVISLFSETFSETIFLSETLANALERRFSGVFLSKILFSTMYDYFLKLGISDSSSQYISNTVSQLVNTSFYAMTPVVITHSISDSIARKLFDEELLSMKNFQQLSDLYIQFLEISFRSFGSNYTTGSNIRLILEASGNFLSSQKISLAENVEILATYFGEALNSSIKTVFTNGEYLPWQQWNELSASSDFDFFDETSDTYPSELRGTSIFSEYILDEILYYPDLSKLFYLPPTNSTLYENFDSSFFSEGVDSSQHLAKLIVHEIAKTSGSLDSFSFAKLYVKSIEKFLTARSVLKPENSIVMARAFVSAMAEALRHKKDSDNNLNILINTTGRFLTKYLIYGVDQTESWSSIILSELSFHPNFPLSRLIKETAPEVLSPSGLLSTESSIRVNNLVSAVRTDILFSDEVDIMSFIYNLTSGALQISNDYPKRKPENAFIQAFLEGIASLIGVINGAYIIILGASSDRNEVIEMYEAFSGILNYE